jgi:hypothetical protein
MSGSGEKERQEELEFEKSPNPKPFRPSPAEHPAAAKARLFAWHDARGTMGTYYDLYPEDRLAEPELRATPPHGRER